MKDLHPGVWIAWATAAVTCIQLAPNPAYVTIVIGVCALVVARRGRAGPLSAVFPALLAMGAAFAVVRIALDALTTRGSGPVLVRLPALHTPSFVGGFVVGGPLDASVVARSAAEAFVVIGILAVCGAFNAVIEHHRLLRLLPRGYAELGVAMSVGVAFVPALLESARASREADRGRTGGVAVRRGRLRRLTGPVLESALERAVALSESMDSRGFGRAGPSASDRRATRFTVAGLAAAAMGLGALGAGARLLAALLVALGCVCVVAAVVGASRASTVTRYRPPVIARRDVAVGAVVLLAPVLLVVRAIAGDATLAFLGAPLGWPPVALVPALTLGLLGAPAVVR